MNYMFHRTLKMLLYQEKGIITNEFMYILLSIFIYTKDLSNETQKSGIFPGQRNHLGCCLSKRLVMMLCLYCQKIFSLDHPLKHY